VLGIVVVGAAVFVPDPRIHYFAARLPRIELDAEDELRVHSLEADATAVPVLRAFEESVGVRAVLLLEPGGEAPILRRDGSRRIFPFNLLIGHDRPPV
jgi:hypothetical protein